MLCKNCGKHIYKSAAFCSKCGAKNEKPPAEAINDALVAAKADEKSSFAKCIGRFWRNKKLFITVTSVCCAVVIGVFGLLAWAFFANRINITDYLDIEGTEGLNDYASLEYDFDYVELAEDLDLDDIRDIEELKELEYDGIFYWGMKTSQLKLIASQYDLDLDDFIDLYKAIEIKVDNDGRLRNEDRAKLEVVVSADKDKFDKKLVGGEMFFDVDDLEDAVVLDLFSAVNITYEGENGNGQLTFKRNSSDSWKSSVFVSSTRMSGLSNGDVITVTAQITNDKTYETLKKELEKEGKYLPKSAQKDFTVTGLSTYAEFDDIDDEIIDKAYDLMKTCHLNFNNVEVSAKSAYFVEIIEGESAYYMEARNALIINLSYTEYIDINGSRPRTMVCMLANIVKNDDGTLGFTKESRILFEGSNMSELEVISNINEIFVGYDMVVVR